MRIGTVSTTALILVLTLGCGRSPDGSAAFPGESWEEASPESQGFDSNKLAAAVRYLEENSGPDGARELVVIDNGRLIWQGAAANKVHGVWSVTKAFTTLCLGLLIDDGKVSLETRAAEVLPELAEHYPEATMRHFATMTSGYRAIGDEPEGSYTHGPSSTPFQPNPEPLFVPGEKYAYWDSAMNIFALVLTKAAGEPLEDLFRRRIAEPIGMSGWRWGDFGDVDGLKVNGGSGNNNRQIEISSLEVARLGPLFLHRGSWNGRELISSSFIDESVRPQVPATLPLGHLESGIDGRGVYGFNWWANGRGPDGSLRWPDIPAGAYSRSGYNNNDLFVIPEWDLVVVRLGLDQGEFEITNEIYNRFLAMIGEARNGD